MHISEAIVVAIGRGPHLYLFAALKRFDMLVLRAQLSILQARPDFAGLRQKIQGIAEKLEDEMAIPAIKAEALLIQAVASDEW